MTAPGAAALAAPYYSSPTVAASVVSRLAPMAAAPVTLGPFRLPGVSRANVTDLVGAVGVASFSLRPRLPVPLSMVAPTAIPTRCRIHTAQLPARQVWSPPLTSSPKLPVHNRALTVAAPISRSPILARPLWSFPGLTFPIPRVSSTTALLTPSTLSSAKPFLLIPLSNPSLPPLVGLVLLQLLAALVPFLVPVPMSPPPPPLPLRL